MQINQLKKVKLMRILALKSENSSQARQIRYQIFLCRGWVLA